MPGGFPGEASSVGIYLAGFPHASVVVPLMDAWHIMNSCFQPSLLATLVALSLGFGTATPAMAAPSSDDDELAMAYGDQPFVSIATGSRLPLSRTPAVASVITAKDIAAIGATDLDEILETVPGLHVARSTLMFTPSYVIRGINLGYNPQVLMLLNGIPLTTIFTGNRGNVWGGMPVENIERVEVIRGPGSALYGADAFSGVINIITKSATDINGTQVGVRAGSFNSADVWMLHGGKWGAVDVAGYLRRGTTDGARSQVMADAQTGLDNAFGTQASRAPGPINNGRDSVDGSLDLSLEKWRVRLGYKERLHVGTGTGVASALDPTGESYSQNLSTDLSYDDPNVTEDWAVSLQAGYLHVKEFSDLVLFPAGNSNVFTDGMIGNPYKWEQHARLGGSAVYSGFSQHRLRLGVGAERESIYKVRETKNYNPDFSPIGAGSLADVTDVSNTVPFMRPHGRTKRYVYGQDEWSFAKDWTLTAGLRQDHYSDFGGTTNPRVAMVWEAAYNVTAKLLYGSAFRAPSMAELYSINNPVVTGNANLKPERMKTLEAAVSWQPRPAVQLGMNVFQYDLQDIIRPVGTVYQNMGQQRGSGLEFEAAWDWSKAWRFSGNYSFQRSTDEALDHDAGNAPHHHVYVRSDWRFVPGWGAHAQVNWISERPRVAGDTRAVLSGYETVDLTVRTDQDIKGWEFAASIRNLFDVDAREPSPYDSGLPFVSLPYDIPLPGRSVYMQASLKF